MIKFFIPLTLFFIWETDSYALHPWEQDLAFNERSPINIAVPEIANHSFVFMADFIHAEKTTDDKVTFLGHIQTPQVAQPAEWFRTDCKNYETEQLGQFNTKFKVFSSPVPIKINPLSSPATAGRMLCGVASSDGNKIYGLFTLIDNINGEYKQLDTYGYEIKDLQANPADSMVSGKLYSYDPFKGLIKGSSELIVDCRSEGFMWKAAQGNAFLNSNEAKYKGWKYTVQSFCKNSAMSKNNTNQNISITTPSIDQAKQQCKDLGYKSGTEKFGNCVLELNK